MRTARAVTDEALLHSGDPEDFGRFYDRHVGAVYAYLAGRTQDAAAAAELTARTFSTALDDRARFRAAGGSAEVWLFAIAQRKLLGLGMRPRAREPSGLEPELAAALRARLVAAAARRARRRLRVPLLPLVAALTAAAVGVAALTLLERRPSQRERSVVPPGADVRPLFGGTLQPNVRYGTLALQPAVTLRVADRRWLALSTESADLLQLARAEQPAGDGLARRPLSRSWFSIGRMTTVYDPAKRGLERSLSPGPADPAGWLRAHPDVAAGPPRPARVAGLEGEVLDLRYRFSRPAHAVAECELRGLECTALAPGEFHRDGALARVYVLKSDPGPLVVMLEALDAEAFRALEAAARPVLDSLALTRP